MCADKRKNHQTVCSISKYGSQITRDINAVIAGVFPLQRMMAQEDMVLRLRKAFSVTNAENGDYRVKISEMDIQNKDIPRRSVIFYLGSFNTKGGKAILIPFSDELGALYSTASGKGTSPI